MTRDQYFADKSELKTHFGQINTAMGARLLVLEAERARLNDFKDESDDGSGVDDGEDEGGSHTS